MYRTTDAAWTTAGNLLTDDLSLADKARSKLRRATAFRSRAPQNHRSPPNLRDTLKPQHTPTSELSQPYERILQPIDRSQGIKLIDYKPKPSVVLRQTHRLKDSKPHPSTDNVPQCSNLARSIGKEQH